MKASKPKVSKITLFLVVAVGFICINGYFLNNIFVEARNSEAWILHSTEILKEVEVLHSALKDAEGGVRGFIVTNNTSYLDLYHSGVTETWAHFRLLKEMTKDNPAHRKLLSATEELITERLSTLVDLINSRNGKRIGGLNIDQLLHRGKSIMDSIRANLRLIRAEENRLYSQRSVISERNNRNAKIAIAFATFLNIIFAYLVYHLVKRNNSINAKETLQKQLELEVQEQLSQIGVIISNEQDTESFTRDILKFLNKNFNVPASSFYILKNGLLRLSSVDGRTLDGSNFSPITEFSLGSGLVGSTALGSEIKVIKDFPKGYFKISSALGETEPETLVLIPLKFLKSTIGVLELALFSEPTEVQLQHLKKCCDLIGTGLGNSQNRQYLETLLETTQMQAQELQSQQEELRASNEELEQQARLLDKQQISLNSRNNELEKVNQYKSDFLAKMSHELRTPLNSLLILASLLKENKDKNLTDKQIQFASTIYDSGNDLLTLINDILDLSKIEARKLSLKPAAFKLSPLLTQLVTSFQPQADKKGLKLKAHVDPDLINFEIRSDSQRISQIIRNFLSNSIKFTEAGHITLSAKPALEKGLIDISVVDTGIGVPENQQNAIFRAFDQGDTTINRKYGGTGLGLTISRELAHLLGGEVYLKSVEGEGSTFTLRIPAYIEENKTIERNTELMTELKNVQKEASLTFSAHQLPPEYKDLLDKVQSETKTLLIVEDDLLFAELVAKTAENFSFTPIVAPSGEIALQILDTLTPKAIMLDIKLPGISGMGVLESIKKISRLRHVPVHMISALDYSQSTMRMGAMGYLGKPVNIEQLQKAVQELQEVADGTEKKILIIEDNEVQRIALQNLLNTPDLHLTCLENGKESLEQIVRQKFDCVILDLNLPDMTGKEFLEQLEKMKINLPPIIVYTGQDLSRDEEIYLRKYSESIILKGARSPERLLDEVNLFLHRIEDDLPYSQKQMLNSLRTEENDFNGKKVLLVDDDLRNVFALTQVLESKGFSVLVARDGVEAVEMSKQSRDLNLILMDLMMPRMDGYEAIREIRKQDFHSSTPIIALTAKAMKGDQEKALGAGANDYLPKPINISNLISVLRVWISEDEFLT